MQIFKFLSSLLLVCFLFSVVLAEDSDAKKRKRGRPRYVGQTGKNCVAYDDHGEVCNLEKENYKPENGIPILREPLCKQVQDHIKELERKSKATGGKSSKSCVITIGYRSCRTNGLIRGAAKNSPHLCGKAADIRNGTCKGLVGAENHSRGTAYHQHKTIGACTKEDIVKKLGDSKYWKKSK